MSACGGWPDSLTSYPRPDQIIHNIPPSDVLPNTITMEEAIIKGTENIADGMIKGSENLAKGLENHLSIASANIANGIENHLSGLPSVAKVFAFTAITCTIMFIGFKCYELHLDLKFKREQLRRQFPDNQFDN